MFKAVGLSRTSYRRGLEPQAPCRGDVDLRDLMQRSAMEARFRRLSTGQAAGACRRPCRECRARLALMRAENLLSLRRQPFEPTTSDRGSLSHLTWLCRSGRG
jgi:hypothetical protein